MWKKIVFTACLQLGVKEIVVEEEENEAVKIKILLPVGAKQQCMIWDSAPHNKCNALKHTNKSVQFRIQL